MAWDGRLGCLVEIDFPLFERMRDQCCFTGRQATVCMDDVEDDPQHFPLQRRVANFAEEHLDASFVERELTRGFPGGMSQQVGAMFVIDGIKALVIDTELLEDLLPFQQQGLAAVNGAVGQQGKGNNASGGFRAVWGIFAH